MHVDTKNGHSQSHKFHWAWRALEIVFTAVVASALTIVATLYIQHKNAPKLTVDYSWCTAVTMPYEDSKNEFVSILVDLQNQTVVEGGAFYFKVNAKSEKDFSYLPNVRSYIGKIIVHNEGRAAANQVKIGVGYMFPADFSITVAPNVHAVLVPIDTKTYGESVYWPNRYEIQIEDLPPGEDAFVTLSWKLDSAARNEILGSVRPNKWYVPEILYLTSKETLGNIRSFIPSSTATQLQGDSLNDTIQPTWKPSVHLKPGVTVETREMTAEEKKKIHMQFDSLPPQNPSAPNNRGSSN